MEIITTRRDFQALAGRLGVRADWHEPDEQDLTARVEGSTFDNAGFWPLRKDDVTYSYLELHVIFSRVHTSCYYEETGEPCDDRTCCYTEDVAAVNLATLCAWATGTAS